MPKQQRAVFITGAASGIGRASALAFSLRGDRVFACDIDSAGLATLAEEAGDGVTTHVLDVTDSAACTAAIQSCVDTLGGLDVLCNIAGVAATNHFHDIDDAAWQRLISINLNSVFFLCRAAIPALKESKGCIVNMASISGLMGQAYTSGYCATKAAVIMLTKALAIEYAGAGIRANAVCPGGVNTPLVAKFSAPDDIDYNLMQRYAPLTRMAEAEEIAEAVLYLSDAQAINGIAMPIDGGVSAG